jgi:hypothetical protein
MDVSIVITDNGDTEPELTGFESESLAEEYAALRGGSTVQTVSIMGDTMARNFINEEAQGV